MRRIARFVAVLASAFFGFFVAVVTPAQAVLVPINDSLFGAGDDGFNITRDTATGLDWLDLTLTDSLNYNQVIASSLVTSGEFQHATLAQVAQLHANGNLVRPDSTPITSISMNKGNPVSLTNEGFTDAQFNILFDAMEVLSVMLGITGPDSGGQGGITVGVTADENAPLSRRTAGFQAFFNGFSPLNCFGSFLPACDPFRQGLTIDIPLGIQADGDAGGQTGHFLVRATPASIVSEPATIALLGIALAGFGFRRRRSAY